MRKEEDTQSANRKKIILISISGIGNNIIFTPTIKKLKQSTDAKITLLTWTTALADVVRGSGYVDEIVVFNRFKRLKDRLRLIKTLRKKRFDISICAAPSNRIEHNLLAFMIGAKIRITHDYPVGNIMTLRFLQNRRVETIYGLHDVEQNLRLLGPVGIDVKQGDTEEVFFHIDKKDRTFANDFLEKNKLKDRVIGMHTGCYKGSAYRRWPEKKFIDLINMIYKRYKIKIILFAGPDEEISVNDIHLRTRNKTVLAAKNTLKQNAAIIEKCSLLISTDSALGHIAAAFNVPAVTIFGPADPSRTSPYGNNHIVVRRNLSCSPCMLYPFYQTRPGIKCNNMKCLNEIEVDEVLSAVSSQLR